MEKSFSPFPLQTQSKQELDSRKKSYFFEKKIIIKGKNEKFLPYYKVLQKQPLKPLYAVIERL
ncbi:hypothetical protein AUJ95_02965 [Candidatus Desantisbacteria bacterium CG2_30_40_21]|uniref:Uncharacterized protein n=2 Tax=unclassified Candidatus Desantisiibacteriota TaxID=3106372 RepID=A0A2M7JBZ5_9BACT|nr:MAG: hypothetical protein AUJ95_02965 [Candidatus Desantisbacteria bacterium CG2_30_40_21]PIX16916.1 MAG: hypothetical protein COZ71_05985 [Candidatus Desantisbacteria bacterium CG_4_8_14_3_um_filter_40_12]